LAELGFVVEERVVPSFDGTPLAVQLAGNPMAPVLLLANGAGASLGAYRFIVRAFHDRFRFVSWDYRGTYGSGRPVGGYRALRVADHAKDAATVLDAVGVDRFHALGWSMGVQVLLELSRTHAAQMTTLVLHNGVAGGLFETAGGRAAPVMRALLPRLLRVLQHTDGVAHAALRASVPSPWLLPLGVRLGMVHHGLDRDVFTEIASRFRQLDLHLYFEVLQELGRHDARDVLPAIAVQTLIVHSSHDVLTPLPVAQAMALAMPHAELVVLPGGTHYALVEMPALINRTLQSFWGRSTSVGREAPEPFKQGTSP
jgi:pimeloyl-ACP methyl ester carboxylesterase